MDERHRIDAWLKLVCLFKHRTEATEACKGGHVKLNGQRVKPAAALKLGDTVEYLGGDDRYHKVVVKGLPDKPVSKVDARTMYDDQTPPQEPDPLRMMLRARGMGRPTKKDRREMERFNKR